MSLFGHCVLLSSLFMTQVEAQKIAKSMLGNVNVCRHTDSLYSRPWALALNHVQMRLNCQPFGPWRDETATYRF
jgi:hypothetical protein